MSAKSESTATNSDVFERTVGGEWLRFGAMSTHACTFYSLYHALAVMTIFLAFSVI